MSAFLSPIGNSGIPFMTQQGVVLAGGQLYTYLAGTTTPQATWTTPAQNVQNANPIVLNSAGLPAQEIWLQQGTAYKFVLADAQNNTLATYDNISGINDTSISLNEWVSSNLTPTYVSGTQFTVPGNQTSVLTLGRRVKASVSAGTVYGTITASAFTTVTTVTVVLDSSALDSGLSAISYGLNSALNTSIPPNLTDTSHVVARNNSAQSITGSLASVSNWSSINDSLGNFAASTGLFTAPTTAFYYVSATLTLSGTFVAGNEIDAQINYNGATVATTRMVITGSTSLVSIQVSALIAMTAGNQAVIRASQSSGGAATLLADPLTNTLNIFGMP